VTALLISGLHGNVQMPDARMYERKRGRDEAVAAMLAALGYSFPKELLDALDAYAESDKRSG
jgi:hypothetical protein